jgi:DNA-directed RNA polymerase III subunit RPC2
LSGELGGVGEARVLDILHNQLFPHIEDLPFARVTFLADCVRKMLRVIQKIDAPASRDDTRNQRLLTSGFLCQMLFENIYKTYIKTVKLNIDEAFSYNESIYSGEQFLDIFSESNRRQIFAPRHITEGLMRGFKGKWLMGANKEESGLLQELDRMSYLNFISHLRHAILNFDTGMKLQGPRRLNPSQYGYFCTSETPSGSSIGITKNLSIMTAISTGSYSEHILEWLFSSRGGNIIKCEYSTPSLSSNMIPVYLNSGIIGYSANPKLLARVLRLMKRGGFLPPLSSSGFSIPERKLFIYIDDGRPLRPLIICEPRGKLPFVDRFQTRATWRDLVVGTLRPETGISSQEFVDPLEGQQSVTLESYLSYFNKYMDKLKITTIPIVKYFL